MTIPSDEEVQRRANDWGQAWYGRYNGVEGYTPPPYALVFLARLLDPAKAAAVFWSPGSWEDDDTVKGHVVAVTERLIYDVSFEGVATDRYTAQKSPGTARVRTLRRSEVDSVRWAAPNVVRPAGSLEAGEIVVEASRVDWSLGLPTSRMYQGGDGFFVEVLAAFGLEP